MGDSASEDLSSYQPAAFKSRFLKTDRSEALKTESGAAAPVSLSSASLALGLRSVRSTFSPLAKLPENVEVKAEENDRLSKNIKDFISRTDHVANEWKNLGQHRRSGSVERGSFFDKSSVSETRDNASWSGIKPRASSVAPMTRTTAISNNPFENQFPSQLPRSTSATTQSSSLTIFSFIAMQLRLTPRTHVPKLIHVGIQRFVETEVDKSSSNIHMTRRSSLNSNSIFLHARTCTQTCSRTALCKEWQFDEVF